MQLIALDLGTRMGFACGKAGHGAPRSGAMILKAAKEPRGRAFGNLIAWLDKIIPAERPALIVKEAALHLGAFKQLGNAAFTVEFTYKLHGVVEGMCDRYGVECRDVNDGTVRKHFIGRARMGTRALTKQAVVQRAKSLKLIPADCADDNRADAVALFDYAAHTFARASGGELVLFGDAA